jgi:DNA-binding SARP family transcriptional activator
LRLKLLGGFEARLGAPLPLPSRKAQALLAYLALSAGRTHPRDKLATLLWGDISQEHARSSLRQALFAIRKALAPVDGALHPETENVALNPERVDVDVTEFERQGRVGSPEALQAAADVYGGDLLEGLAVQESPFEEWLTAERERLRELALEVLARLLTAQRDQGHTEAAIQTAARLLALDQLQEPVHRTLMRLHAQLGRRGSALRQYQICVGILQRELATAAGPARRRPDVSREPASRRRVRRSPAHRS